MRKYLTVAAMALLLAGCNKPYDDSSILERVASLETRVTALETAVQGIQSAVGDGIFVQKVEQYADPATGKTVGVTVTYTSGKVVYFEISPKADSSAPVLSVITSGSGQLVWAVDGIPIKINGEEVPVYQTPEFTIDADGNLMVSIDGSDPVVVGQVTSGGATLQDGIFKDIRVEDGKVVLVLADDSEVTIPFAEAFKLNIEKNVYAYNNLKAIEIPYTVSAKTESTVVGVAGYSITDFYVEVQEDKILVTPLKYGVAAVLMAYADTRMGLTSIVSLSIEPEGVTIADTPYSDEYDYVAAGEYAEINAHVVSNVEFDVVPEDDWIHVISVKGVLYTITLELDDNNTGKVREGSVAFYKKGTKNIVQLITIAQDVKPDGPKNLSAKESANCYIVTAAGDYKFKPYKGNSLEFISGVASAEVLWETWNNNEEVAANSVIAKVSYDGGFISFSTPATLKPGNAVIAAKDASGTILWSWHIWVPATTIETKDYGIFSSPMMDRNLGALVVATADDNIAIESFGLTYQWGRKDPFVGAGKMGEESNAKVAGVALSTTDGAGDADESKITLEQSIQNPTLLGHTKNKDWLTPFDNSLWKNDEKTIYDPCPPGYRVPARDKSQPFHSSYLTAFAGWAEATNWFTLGNPVAVFPFAGYRDDYGPGAVCHPYDRAVYWTAYASAEDGGTAYYVNVRKGSKHALGEAGKSRAGSVRCVRK